MRQIEYDKMYVATAGSCCVVEIIMTGEDIDSIAQSGENDVAVEEVWQRQEIKEQLAKYSDENLRDCLREYGAWEESELNDRATNEQRIIWCAAWDLADQEPEQIASAEYLG